jgi:hypothetical protein
MPWRSLFVERACTAHRVLDPAFRGLKPQHVRGGIQAIFNAETCFLAYLQQLAMPISINLPCSLYLYLTQP